jgi:hypothetical protein
MPDATITSTASTFGTISGVFSADQSTISGTISGIVPGTLTGSVGVPGPAGPAGIGLPAGGTSGQFLQKTSGVDYATDWVTVNLTGLATESWVTAGFYPLSGNPSGFLTASSLTPYLTKADNLGSLTNFATARDNLGLGSLSSPTFAGITAQGSGANVANLTPTSLSLTHATSGSFTIQPSVGITFPDASVQTTAFTTSQLTAYLAKASNLSDLASTSTARTNLGLGSLAVVNDAPSDGSQYARKNGAWDVVTTTPDYITSVSSPLSVTTGNLSIDLSAYAPLASPAFTGNPTAPTATFGDNDTSLATTAFVQSALAGGTAVARNLEVEVRNQSGSTIAAGSIVYISGATGNKPLITLAQANNDANSAQTIGFVKTAIANNGTGYVIVRGELENIDTSALTEGVQLYLSPTVAGSWTTTKPSAPQHLVYVGIVIRSHPTLGTILVAVQNGYELGEIHDVSIGTLANNDLLAYESSTDLWKNKTYSALGLLTSADAATTYAPKASPTFTGLATFDNPGNYAISVPGSGVGYDTRLDSNVFSMRNNSNEVIRLSPTGIKYPDGVTQTVAYPGSSDFLLKADNLSGLASTSTARTNLGLGTMATATAADYSTTTVANGLYYPLSSNPAGYLTSAPVTSVAGRTGAITLAVADVSGAAPLASPTFSGTPSLPTGTIGVTQTAGNNTTALATTAFVQQEVPSASTTAAGKVELATVDEALRPSSSTLGMTPDTTREMLMYPGYINLFGGGNVATSGTGAASTFTFGSQRWHAIRSPNATVAGYGMYIFDYSFSGIGMAAMTRGSSSHARKWNNKIWVSGRTVLGQFAETTSGLNGDANCTARVMLGGRSSAGTGGMQAADPGIGWRVAGGGSVALVMTVSTGSVLTETTSSFTPVLGQVFDWKMYSDGTGNVTLWVNDSQVATSTGGPSTSTAENSNFYCEVVEQTASAVTPLGMGNFGSKVFWSQA